MDFYYNTHDCTWVQDGYRVGEAKEGDIDSSSADAVFTNVRGGIAEGESVYKDGVCHLRFVVKQNGPANGNGIYVWHDADWANIAYSQTLSGTKTALVGSADKATTRVQEDACGERIGNPPNRGSCAISASGTSLPTSPPGKPSVGVSTYGGGANVNYIAVTWTGGDGATSFDLYRSTTTTRPSSPFATNVTSPYYDYKSTSGLTPGVNYNYWVAAVNSAGTTYSDRDWGNILVSLALGKSTDSYVASGGNGSASVTANTSWSASADVSWISFGTSAGNGNGTLTYAVAANKSLLSSSRTGTITVTAGPNTAHPSTKTIAVTQEAPAPTTYTVVFNANGGSGTMENQTIHYCTFEQIGLGGMIMIDNTGENTPLSANAFTKSGYVFSGWSTSPNGAVSFGDKAEVTNLAAAGGSITLYAVWAPESDFEIVDGVLTKYKGSGGAVTIPSGVMCIGDYSFSECYGLTSVTIPSSVTSIGSYAFCNCSLLTSVSIPSGVTSIGGFAFQSCSGLTSMTIPSSVTSIADCAFWGCNGLTSINVDSANKNYRSIGGVLYDKDAKELICCPGGARSVTIPSGVTSIGYQAFSACTSLTSVTIPSDVTSIGDWAFYYCSGLTSVSIPSGVTSIGAYVLCGCSGLTSVTIPSSVTSIGSYALLNCDGLVSVTIPSSVTAIGGSAFLGCSGLKTVYVSSGDAERVRDLMSASGFSVGGVEFVEPATTYTVTFNANGGTGTMTSQTITYGVSTALKANTFTKSGYTFAGWSKTAGGSVAYANGASVSNLASAGGSITLYAVWTPQVVAPSAPTEVTATDGLYADYARVTWSAVSGATSYKLYRSTTTSRPSSVAIPSPGSMTVSGVISPYNDTTATPGIKYYYWIASVYESDESSVLMVSSYDTGYRAVSLTLDKTTSQYALSGGSGSATVKANTSWSASANVSWITLGTKSANGNGTLTYTVAANTSSSSRSGTITVTAGSGTSYPATKTISVSQSAVSDFAITDGVLTKYNGAGGAVTIPSGVTSIGDFAFRNCSALTSVTIPSSVTSIGYEAFYECSGLKSVTIPSSVTSIGNYAFSDCIALTSVVIPSSVKSIGWGAFDKCSGLKSVTISEGVTSIGRYAFYGCNGLTSVTIPSSVTSIDWYAFEDCSGLMAINVGGGNNDYCSIEGVLYSKQKTKLIQCPGGKAGAITIPSGVTSIGGDAFYGCSALTSVTIPSSVTSIGDNAFFNCGGLTSVNVDPANMYYCSIDGVLYNKDTTELICCPGGAKSVTIPSSVTIIGDRAFYRCSSLTSVMMSSSVTSIGDWAFSGCSSLASVTIPSRVTSVGDYAFDGCKSLTSVTIPSSVTSIGSFVFYDCSGLTLMTIPSSVTSIRSYTFIGCSSLKVVCVSDNGDIATLKQKLSQGGLSVDNVVFTHVDYYSVSFNANGGAGSMSSQNITYGVSTALKASAFTYSGYVFAGWATTADGPVVYADNASVLNLALPESSVTLYAVWEKLVVPAPSVSPADGATFSTDSCLVTLDCAMEGAAIYYTTNGATPKTSASYLYTQPFEIRGTVNVKAVAVKDGVKSEYATAKITKVDPVPVETPVITPVNGTTFSTDSCEVTITCPTDGVTIYYTTDGTLPTVSESCRYKGVFSITDTATIKAIAVKEGWLDSACATVTITKVGLTLEGVLGADSRVRVTTGGEADWVPINDANAKEGSTSARSGLGNADDDSVSWIQLSVNGKGTLSFWCKTSCEHDDDNAYTWDRVEVMVDGQAKPDWYMDGTSQWVQRTIAFDTVAEHAVRIAYIKDESDYDGEDCAWLDGVVWTPVGASSESLPDLGDTPSAADVAAAVVDAADPQVAAKVDATNYNDFRAWAGKVKAKGGSAAGVQGVMSAENAWLSYALGQDTLLETVPTDGDLAVEAFEPTAETGTFEFTVSVKDVEVGSETAKENLKKVFGLEGAATLDNAAFSSDKVEIDFGTPVDGKVKFTATPKDASARAFFMKVKMLP